MQLPTLRTTCPFRMTPASGSAVATHYSVPESFEFDCCLGGFHVRVRATIRDANVHLDCGRVRTLEPVQGPALSSAEQKHALELAEDLLDDVATMLRCEEPKAEAVRAHLTERQQLDRRLWRTVRAQVLQHLAAGASTEAEAALSAWVATYLELLCRRQDARAADEWLEARAEAAAGSREDAAFQQYRDTH